MRLRHLLLAVAATSLVAATSASAITPVNQITWTGGLGADTLLGGPGNDLLYARGNRRDVVDCGAGTDIASVDKLDVVRNCEKVFRR
jgi:Ca2+-binding RTX toxin-like protein